MDLAAVENALALAEPRGMGGEMQLHLHRLECFWRRRVVWDKLMERAPPDGDSHSNGILRNEADWAIETRIRLDM
jgi:hypothetical protein